MAQVDEPSPDGADPAAPARSDLALFTVTAALLRFREQMAQYRDLLEQASRYESLSGQRPPNLLRVGRGLTREQRQSAERAAASLVTRVTDYLGRQPTDSPAALSTLSLPPGEKQHPLSWELAVAEALAHAGSTQMHQWFDDFTRQCEGNEQMARYALAHQQWVGRGLQKDAIARALLPSITAAFEELLAALVRLWYLLYPKADGVPSTLLTAGEALAFASRSDMLRWVTDKRVGDFLKNSPVEWQKTLHKKLHIDLSHLGFDWNQFCEVFARRHVLVHASSLADQQYIDHLPRLLPKPALGELLRCDAEYVTEALDLLHGMGSVLGIVWLTHFIGDYPGVADIAADLVFEALKARRWLEARSIAEVALAASLPDHSHHELRVNLWMARRELGDQDWDQMRAEIARWEPPSDQPQFRVAQAALLHDEARVVAELEAYRNTTGRHVPAMATWPLLADYLVRSPRVRSLLQGNSVVVATGVRHPSRRPRRK